MANRIISKVIELSNLECTACESKIENHLMQIEGIQDVEVSYVTSTLMVIYDADQITLEQIVQEVEKLDYGVKKSALKQKDNGKSRSGTLGEKAIESNPTGWLVIIGILVFGAYLIVKHTVGFNFIPEVTAGMGYGLLFLVGLLSSLHCIAMCGGINLSVCVSYQSNQQGNNRFSKLLPSFLYNAGRVLSYTIIGGIIGAVGSVFSLSNAGKTIISVAAGLFMIIMGLNMLNLFPGLKKIIPHMPKIFAKKIYANRTNKGPFVVGLLNGLMPCGSLQAMQLYALGTGSFLHGAASMFVFSLGTVPLMFAFGALGSLIKTKFAKKMVMASAILVMILGVIMLQRGAAFSGITFSMGSSNSTEGVTTDDSEQSTAVVSTDIQKISSTLESNRYPKLTVQAGVPVEWTITASDETLNGCNGTIVIPEYGVEKDLVVGENVITFTPIEAGSYGYSCWMGMIRSSITVTDSN